MLLRSPKTKCSVNIVTCTLSFMEKKGSLFSSFNSYILKSRNKKGLKQTQKAFSRLLTQGSNYKS